MTGKRKRMGYQPAYYLAHKQEKAAQARAYYQAHLEERRAYSRAYWEAHKQEKAAYYQAHKKAYAARSRARREARKGEGEAQAPTCAEGQRARQVPVLSYAERYRQVALLPRLVRATWSLKGEGRKPERKGGPCCGTCRQATSPEGDENGTVVCGWLRAGPRSKQDPGCRHWGAPPELEAPPSPRAGPQVVAPGGNNGPGS